MIDLGPRPQLDENDRLWNWILAIVALGIVITWTTAMPTAPPQAAQTAVSTTTTTTPPVQTVELPGALTLRSFYARQVAERREDEDVVVATTAAPTTTTTTQAATTTSTTSTTRPPWRPADECQNVPNPGPVVLTADTMRWCPTVANHLAKYDWQPHDLFRLLVYMECESNGDPLAVNPSSGTHGLYQFRPSSWESRSERAGHAGDWRDPHNNIGTALWLVKSGEPGSQPMENAWNGCAGHDVVQETLRNGGA